ncbi:hypothetical protein B0H16DRAFT_1573709 [Mycena metata]|uniref:Uncharacterized protein n=1 Tax=Mycena metata TaxID=1033252 RepID=A0AAD7I876_9AGAR|nr:hypothetical protein B0H16DRAFT_1573709 [Mycena metata]
MLSLTMLSADDNPRPALPPPIAGSATTEWLPNMIFVVKNVATGAEFLPFPFMQTTFSALVLLLETVEKVIKNRDDLRDLCSGALEIVLIIQGEISAHPNSVAARFLTLCEGFLELVRLLQHELEELQRSRRGMRGRLREIVGATDMAGKIGRYKYRMNELRSNLVLLATLGTNLNVADVRDHLATLDLPHGSPTTQFRRIPLGDINLLNETPMKHKGSSIKVFAARVQGEKMTIAEYADEGEWQKHLALYSHERNPDIWQLFGVSHHGNWKALIFHDELMPLAVYRQWYRPSSDLVWACIEGMLFKQFKDSKHHNLCQFRTLTGVISPRFVCIYPGSNDFEQMTICVRKEPIRLCLTMPDTEWTLTVDHGNKLLSMWDSNLYKFQPSASVIEPIVSNCPGPQLQTVFSQKLDWKDFYATITAPWRGGEPISTQESLSYSLGMLVVDFDRDQLPRRPFHPWATVPHSCDFRIYGWNLEHDSKLSAKWYHKQAESWKSFRFPPHSFARDSDWREYSPIAWIVLDPADTTILSQIWLSQANKFVAGNSDFLWGLVDMISCHLIPDAAFRHLLRSDGTDVEAYLFVCLLTVHSPAFRHTVALPKSNHHYWALDPEGKTPLSEEECDNLGLPRMILRIRPWATFWEPYHYNAVRQFHEEKGFDPSGGDVTRLLGLPVITPIHI